MRLLQCENIDKRLIKIPPFATVADHSQSEQIFRYMSWVKTLLDFCIGTALGTLQWAICQYKIGTIN